MAVACAYAAPFLKFAFSRFSSKVLGTTCRHYIDIGVLGLFQSALHCCTYVLWHMAVNAWRHSPPPSSLDYAISLFCVVMLMQAATDAGSGQINAPRS